MGRPVGMPSLLTLTSLLPAHTLSVAVSMRQASLLPARVACAHMKVQVGEAVPAEILSDLGVTNTRAAIFFIKRDTVHEDRKQIEDVDNKCSRFVDARCKVVIARNPVRGACRQGIGEEYPGLSFYEDEEDRVREALDMDIFYKAGTRLTYVIDESGVVLGRAVNQWDPFYHAAFALRTLEPAVFNPAAEAAAKADREQDDALSSAALSYEQMVARAARLAEEAKSKRARSYGTGGLFPSKEERDAKLSAAASAYEQMVENAARLAGVNKE
mmetsp:Transcript_43848/g.99109  ORF Transcript_43848/g.99109 Transcript_43848/m.99109 type:complete len:271 (-) Transcript_43848:311-1123(-)